MATDALRTPTQDRARRTRAALLDAGEREFATRGYAAATSRSIAERAGVATGSFYQYFRDKDALLREIAATRLARIHELTLGGLERERVPRGRPVRASADILAAALERMRRLVEFVIAYHREDPRLHAVLGERRLADPELDALTNEAERALVDRMARVLERLAYPGDREAMAFVILRMVQGAVLGHVLGPRMVSDGRFVDALAAAIVRVALPGAPPGKRRARRRG